MGKFLLFLVALLAAGVAQAKTTADYYDQHEKGWHWYDDPAPHETATKDASVDPVEQMSAVKQALQRALDTAILQPTPAHVQSYIALQNAMSQRASQFSTVWQQVLLENPTLNYSLSHPTSQVGKAVYLDQHKDQEEAAIHALAQHRGLFFFYRSTCPYCQRFAPIVKAFTKRYGIAVVAITTDGIALPEFPNSKVDQGQAAKFHITVEPALFTVDPYSGKALPVSYGLTTEDELRSRILEIAQGETKKS